MSEKVYKIMKENKFEIENEISNDLKCIICKELLIKACNAPCGCRFCSDCIEHYLEGNDKFCPGTTRYCQKKMINLANDVVIDNPINIRLLEIVVKCPRQNCEFKNELQMIENHMKTCNKRPISCPYNAIGCETNEVVNDEMKSHLNENNLCHSKLLIDLINNLRYEMESMRNEITELKMELKLQSTNQQKICEMEIKEFYNTEEIEKLNEEMVALKNENQSLRSEIETNVKSINEQIEKNQTILQQQMYELKQNYEQQQPNKEVELLRREIDKISEQNAKYRYSRLDNQDDIFQKSNWGIKRVPPKKFIEKKKLNVEICGEFDWLIENISQQKRDIDIYSKSFYSWPSGYKMCLSVNINMIFEGFDVRFHLMRGAYDDKLQWPFKYSVTVDIINSEDENIYLKKTGKHSDCPDHVGWSKPSNDRNEGIRVYNWLDIPISNNQMRIKCRVSCDK